MELYRFGKVTREYIKANRGTLFVFGDNDLRTGLGGMAKECRGESNTRGIRTKKKPSTTPDSYYTDDEFNENCRKIDEDIRSIISYFDTCTYIRVFIPNRIGGGLAKLDKSAPRTYEYLCNAILKLINDLRTGLSSFGKYGKE